MGRNSLDTPTTDNQYDRLMKRIKADFVTGDDGFKLYWPDTFKGGGFNSWLLRAIADELDKVNEPWQNQKVLDKRR
jgi:hypothetical protein